MITIKTYSLLILALLIGCNGINAESPKEHKAPDPRPTIEASSPAKTPSSNPYNLSTEEHFEATYTNEIEPYWNKYKVEGKFTGVDGVEIKYVSFIREGEKGAIVISSGRTEGYFKYHELVYDLGKQGYSVYIHDHRGQGHSGRMASNRQMGHVNNFEDYVQDLHTFVDKVVKKTPHPKLFLLAHSMGGGIAARYIEEYPNDFTAAALSSPMLEPGKHLLFVNEGCKAVESTDWIRTNIRGIKTPRYVLGKSDYEKEDCGNSELTHSEVRCKKTADLYEQFPDTKLGGPSTHWAAEACKASKQLRSKVEASKIRIPVLVLQAGEDKAVAHQGQEEFCKNLNSSQHVKCEGETPQVIKDAYHELFVEKDEYRIPALTKILDFFGKQ